MSDLTSLMTIAPGTASYMMGQNTAQEQATNLLKQKELADLIQQRQAAAQQSAQMNPLLLQHQQAVNQGLAAQLPGQQALSLTQQQAATLGAKTLDSTVAANNATNQGVVDKQQDAQVARQQKLLLDAGAQLGVTPAPLRAKAFNDFLEANKVNMQNPQIQNMIRLAQQNPEGFPGMIQQYADALGRQATAMNPAAQASMTNGRVQAGATVESARIHAGATTKAAQITADSRLAVAQQKAGAKVIDVLEQVKSGKLKAKEIPAALEAQAHQIETFDPEQAKYLRDYAQRQELANRDLSNPKPPVPIPGLPKAEERPSRFGNKPTVGQTSSGTKFKIITD